MQPRPRKVRRRQPNRQTQLPPLRGPFLPALCGARCATSTVEPLTLTINRPTAGETGMSSPCSAFAMVFFAPVAKSIGFIGPFPTSGLNAEDSGTSHICEHASHVMSATRNSRQNLPPRKRMPRRKKAQYDNSQWPFLFRICIRRPPIQPRPLHKSETVVSRDSAIRWSVLTPASLAPRSKSEMWTS